MKNRIILSTILALVIFPQNSYAYLDPGTGSMIFQVVVGVVGAIFLGGSTYLQRLKKFFNSKKKK